MSGCQAVANFTLTPLGIVLCALACICMMGGLWFSVNEHKKAAHILIAPGLFLFGIGSIVGEGLPANWVCGGV